MKITVKAKALATGLSFVGRAAARQGSPAPHLASVLFETDEEAGLTTMRATDAEIAASLTSRAPRIEESGRAAVSVRTLSDLIGRVDPGKDVVLEANENGATLTVAGTENRYSLRAAKSGEFPPMPEFPTADGRSFRLKAKTLGDAIRRVGPAASTDDSRPVLTGLLLSFETEGDPDATNAGAREGGTTSGGDAADGATTLSVVATDSYRMMVARDRSEEIARAAGAAVIPARALKEAARLCSLGPEHIDVALTDTAAFFRVGGVMLSTRLIAGSFPEYRKLLPEGETFEHTFSVDARALLEVLHRVNLFAVRQSPPVPVRLAFDAARDLLSVSVESQAVGSAAESLRGKAVTPVGAGGRTSGRPEGGEQRDGDENFEILFDPSYLIDAVKSCADAGGGGGDVVFRMKAPHKPAILTPAGPEHGHAGESSVASLKCLIMPMADPHNREGAPS